MRKLLLASAAMVALGGPALAADAVPPSPAPPAPIAAPTSYDWTGPYVGFYTGYGFGNSAATGTAGTPFDEGGATGIALDVETRGLFGGVTIGYNYQAGGLVFGVEGTGGFLNLQGATLNDTADVAGVLDDDFGNVNYGWYGTLAARFGVALDRTLLFATAGGIVTQFNGAYGDLTLPATETVGETTTLGGPQFGYVIGGGAEFALDTNWTAKLEYNYMNLGTDTTTTANADAFTQRNNAHLVRFGLNYLFQY